MSTQGPSNYSKFQSYKKIIQFQQFLKNGSFIWNGVRNIEGKVLGVNYYESVYSPMVTASFLQLDTGGTVLMKNGQRNIKR